MIFVLIAGTLYRRSPQAQLCHWSRRDRVALNALYRVGTVHLKSEQLLESPLLPYTIRSRSLRISMVHSTVSTHRRMSEICKRVTISSVNISGR